MILECTNCNAHVETEEIGEYEYLRNEDHPSGRFVLLKCKKCGSPILINQDNIGNMVEGNIWDSPITLFPNQDTHFNPNAPKAIRTSYEEAAKCFRNRAYTASAIMCRKTLEGICKNNGISERNLVQAIRKMKESKIINDQLFEWADTLRMAGNEAVHGVDITVSREDSRDMLDFTNAIIDYIYSFKEKFEQFKKRREKDS